MNKILITVEISITDDVADKYPLYSSNYKSVDDFIDSRIDRLESIHPIDKYGYSVRVLSREEVKLLNIMENEEN